MKATLLARINERQSIVDRHTSFEPIVVCSYFDETAEEGSQWIWGHYFATIGEAISYLIEDGADINGLVKLLANTIEKQSEEKKPSECERYAEEIRGELLSIYRGFMDDPDPVDFWDWATNEVLDYNIVIDYCGAYAGVRAAVTLGGPSAYVDTFRGEIEVYWGTDRATAWVPAEVCEEIDEVFREYYEARV